MSSARFIVGDVLEVLRSMPDDSVDLVLTSPPFLALRSYLPADHPQKDREFGSEPTPGAFIDALLDVVEECRRVLAPHGSLAFELGDTYSGSGGAGGDYAEAGLREGQNGFRQQRAPGWPQPKSLACVPQLLTVALSYGFNPLTGRRTDPWIVRNVVRWVRPNPPVAALGDKFRPATSEMVVATMSRTRYFDLDSVREEYRPHVAYDKKPGEYARRAAGAQPIDMGSDAKGEASYRGNNPVGAPPLDWWAIPTEGYPGSHYATWPRDLLVRPIKAMTPERVCRVCGEPSRRITEPSERWAGVVGKSIHDHTHDERGRNHRSTLTDPAERTAEYVTKGWTDCGHDSWRPGLVLDCFAGSGTTLAVATGHGRDAIGIDLDERNADLAMQRVGMFLTVKHFNGENVA